jgi:hypothetical protein
MLASGERLGSMKLVGVHIFDRIVHTTLKYHYILAFVDVFESFILELLKHIQSGWSLFMYQERDIKISVMWSVNQSLSHVYIKKHSCLTVFAPSNVLPEESPLKSLPWHILVQFLNI